MRYHWGLGVGHAYSHDRDVLSQKYSTTGPEEDPSGSSTQADDVSGDAAGANEKQNESNERLQISEPEPEDAGDVDVNNGRTEESESDLANAKTRENAANDELESDGDSESVSSDSSNDCDREDFNNEEQLELYHTYNPEP